MTTSSAPDDAFEAAGEAVVRDVVVSWRLLDLDGVRSPDLGILTPSERDRAARFQGPVLRRHAQVRRVLLRTLLSTELDLPAAALELGAGPRGKPRIEDDPAGRIAFNTSHRDRWWLLAWIRDPAPGVELGVDLEPRRSLPDGDSLARRWLRSEERTEAAESGLDLQDTGFLRLWTRKEAVMKATGRGLALDPRAFTVPAVPEVTEPTPADVPAMPDRRFDLLDLGPGPWPRAMLGSVCVMRDA